MDSTVAPEKPVNPVIFSITISWPQVQSAYLARLQELAGSMTLDGFRQGKVPLPMVEEKVGKKRIYSDVIQKVLPPAYQEEIRIKGLIPMISPRVKAVTIDEEKDWVFEIAIVTKPVVDLPGLEDKLRSALASGKIVIPGKEEQSKEERLKIALDTVLDTAKVTLPQLLIDEEVNFRLSQLVDQVQALGMTIEQYLASKRLTADSLRQSYEKTARDALMLNLALDNIATDQGFNEKDRISKAIDWLLTH